MASDADEAESGRWLSPHYQRLVRCYEFENKVPWIALIKAMEADANAPEPVTAPCPCSRCSEPIHEWDQDTAMQFVVNNLHGELQPCEDCGRAKSEYVDHGTWGEYRCWWCNDRTADSRVLPKEQIA